MTDRPSSGFDRRTLFAMLLAFVVMQVWMTVFAPAKDGDTDAVVSPTPAAVTATPMPTAATPPVVAPVTAPSREIPREFCHVGGTVETDGGYLTGVALHDWEGDYKALPLWKWAWKKVSFQGPAPWAPYDLHPGPQQVISPAGRLLGVGVGTFDTPAPRVEVLEETPKKLVTRGVTPEGIEVVRTLEVRDDCLVSVSASWHNAGSAAYQGSVWLAMHDAQGVADRAQLVSYPWAMVDGSAASWTSITDPDDVPGPVQWFGFADQYFGAFLVPDEPAKAGTLWMTRTGSAAQPLYGEHLVVADKLAPGETITRSFRMYFGPKDYTSLQAISPDLGKAVQLGWFALFGGPLLWLLKLYHGFVGNWGVAIILLTFTVKAVFFPLTHASMKSGARMTAIQPKLAELREKYANEPEELNRQTIALFRDNGVNPVGGCLPMFLQMPVWIALYNVLQTSVQLYHTKFLYLEDLSSPDPYAVLPLMVVGLMTLQQRMIPMGNMDPAQQSMMRIMPIVFGVLFFTFPSGLVVYMFVNTTLSMLQQLWFKAVFKTAPGAVM